MPSSYSAIPASLVVRVADHDLAAIPYGNLDKLSYEYTKKHRITTGAVVMIFSLGAGAVVMLTKSKSNWLYTDFHEQDSKKTVVLKLEKKDLQRIFAAAKTHTLAWKPSTSAMLAKDRHRLRVIDCIELFRGLLSSAARATRDQYAVVCRRTQLKGIYRHG
jgi:hypothetical protein